MTTALGKVLLIDESDDRTSLAEALRRRGWIVETVSTGRLGIDAAMKNQPDIVVTELVLPEVQGLNYARTLRTCIEHDVLVVGITTELDALHAQARAAGFDEVRPKPVDVDGLHELLLSHRFPRSGRSDARATRKMEKLKPSS